MFATSTTDPSRTDAKTNRYINFVRNAWVGLIHLELSTLVSESHTAVCKAFQSTSVEFLHHNNNEVDKCNYIVSFTAY